MHRKSDGTLKWEMDSCKFPVGWERRNAGSFLVGESASEIKVVFTQNLAPKR